MGFTLRFVLQKDKHFITIFNDQISFGKRPPVTQESSVLETVYPAPVSL